MSPEVELGAAPRIAVIKLGALGDGVYAFPLVSALKALRPAARITWIIEARLRDLPRLHPAVAEVVTVDTRGWRRAVVRGRWSAAWGGVAEFVRAVRDRFDVAFDAQGLVKSGVAAWLTRAPVRIGFAPEDCRERGNAWAMTHHAPAAGRVHAVERNLGLLRAIGAPVPGPVFDVAVDPSDDAWVTGWMAAHGVGRTEPLVALHPGAGHAAKQWGLLRFTALAARLANGPSVRPVLVAGPEEAALVRAAADSRSDVVAVPPGVGALAALLRRCRVVVGGDTGPLHLAAALGRPTVALYGPSDPVLAAPFGTGHHVIKYPCSCGWVPGPHFNRRCPDAPCLAAIGVDEVLEAIEKQLIAHSS